MKKFRKVGIAGTSFLMAIFILLFFNQNVGGFSDPSITITPDQTIADQFTRHTVTGITTPLPMSPDVPGFIGASYVTIGDINEDGIKEIICTSGVGVDASQNTADGAVAIFTWDGVNLGSWTQSVINNTFPFPNETIIRDMDNDGDLDIMVMDNFIAGWSTRFVAGIYYLENQNGDITQASNWVKRTIFQGAPDLQDGNWFSPIGKSSYHRAFFLDVDGDGSDDFITTKISMEIWQNGPDSGWWWTDYPGLPDYPYPGSQYSWMEVFRKENNSYVQTDADGTGWGGTSYGYSRHAIGEGGGFMFNLADIDGDSDLDIVAPQFFIQNSGSLIVKGPGDFRGDSICWFENPGAGSGALLPWNRYTIDNWYTSPNPTGRNFEVVASDIDHDGNNELVVSTHNHQDYKPNNVPSDPNNHRIWPSGIYYLEIPGNAKATSQWAPISLETGDPNLDPTNATAVANDVYAVDRSGGPYSQGSPGTVRTDDMNGDHYPELVVPGDGKGALYYYESVGNLNYKRAALYIQPKCMPGDAKIVDIEGDGDKDIIAVIYDTSVLKPPPASVILKSSSVFVFEKEGNPIVCGDGEIEAGEQCETNADCASYGSGWTCSQCQCQEPPTLIELISFDADAGWKSVTLQWSTASEIDNAGFNIYRAETEDGEYIKINKTLISAQGAPTQGASYRFVDRGLKNKKTYFYKLEDIDLSGSSALHGPISATPSFFAIFKYGY